MVTAKRTIWSDSERDLIEWFNAYRTTLPIEPFQATVAHFVVDPKRWYENLEQDIACGPAGARAVLGALHHDLRALREYVNRKAGR